MVAKNIMELIGNTPMLELSNLKHELGFGGSIFAKLEAYNPAGSVKDRVALSMIEAAGKAGKLTHGSVIIEPTSGNTGIGLAAIGRAKGYRVVLTMPSTMSVERRKLLRAYGAEIVLTDGAKGMRGAIEEANRLAEATEGAFLPDQFENPANPEAHYTSTGPEIFSAMEGRVDFFVAGVGTGGTVTGVGWYLKERLPKVKIVAVEPASSPVLTEGRAGAHAIQGIGAGFVPKVLERGLLDEILPVNNEEAFETAKTFMRAESMLIGISSGAALAAAVKIASRKENKNKRIAVLFPDGGDRYFSTPLFDF